MGLQFYFEISANLYSFPYSAVENILSVALFTYLVKMLLFWYIFYQVYYYDLVTHFTDVTGTMPAKQTCGDNGLY